MTLMSASGCGREQYFKQFHRRAMERMAREERNIGVESKFADSGAWGDAGDACFAEAIVHILKSNPRQMVASSSKCCIMTMIILFI